MRITLRDLSVKFFFVLARKHKAKSMKHLQNPISLTIILFFFLNSHGFSQIFPVYPEKELDQAKIVVTYLKTYRQDSLIPRLRDDRMTLLIGEKVSSFYSEAVEAFRKISMNFKTVADLQTYGADPANMPRSAFLYRIFKNYPEGKITTTDRIPIDSYLYTENLPLFEWNITGDIDSISGYPVYKATTHFGGRDWVAWFAPEIPYNDGPYKFNGLPGLILKIHDTRNHYLFEVVAIETPKEISPILFTEQTYIRTSKEGFLRAWSAFLDTGFTGRAEVVPHNQSRNTMSNLRSRYNNSIELIAE